VTDPFAPPKANLDLPEVRGPRPLSVKLAVWTIVTSMALQLAWIAGAWLRIVSFEIPDESRGIVLGSILVGSVLFSYLGWKIHHGRNWARWGLSVWIVLGVLGQAWSIAAEPASWNANGLLGWIAGVIGTGLNLATVVLLFLSREARHWFRVRPVPSS
jgi:hypothetical protein